MMNDGCQVSQIVQYQKISIPTSLLEGHWKFCGKGWDLKKSAKVEYPGGWGDSNKKKFSGVYCYFQEKHIFFRFILL